MHRLTTLALLLFSTLLIGCSAINVDVSESDAFARAGFKTYSWRTEPLGGSVVSRDPIYVIDPLLRNIVNENLEDLGYTQVPRGGEFTVDYIYAPGTLPGAESELTSNITVRAGVRPNATLSGAERDNAIALSGVRDTRNIALQFNRGDTGEQLWMAQITKIAHDLYHVDRSEVRDSLKTGINRAFRELPRAGQPRAD